MDDLEALKIARVQLIAKIAQLTACRVCGDSKARYQAALDNINNQIAVKKLARDVKVSTTPTNTNSP